MPLRSHRRVLRTSRMTRAGMRPRRARARARSDWTRSLIRMKTGLTGRKKSRRATAVRDQEQRRLPARKIIRIETTEADDSLSGPGSTSETKSSVAKPGSTTTTAAETAASSEKTSPGASDNSGVKSPVTEIQDPGNSGNSDAAGPGGPAGPGA